MAGLRMSPLTRMSHYLQTKGTPTGAGGLYQGNIRGGLHRGASDMFALFHIKEYLKICFFNSH